MAKVRLILEISVDLPVTKKEANRVYPDTLWPLEALTLDKVSEIGINNLVKDHKNIIVKDVFVDETVQTGSSKQASTCDM